MFKHYTRRPRAVQSSYYAGDIAKMYNWPDADGTGQTIAFIELGGGYSMKDLQTYATRYNLPPIDITAVEIGAAKNNPADPSGASDEVLLDIQTTYGVVPKSNLRVYFAENTDTGFINAIKQAIADKVDIISISWGAPENQWNSQSIKEFNLIFEQACNAEITVLCAAGDNDSGDGELGNNVDFPGSSPFCTCVGGTYTEGQNGQIVKEVVWNNSNNIGTGGGYSIYFGIPNWQIRDKIVGKFRMIPDISSNADPNSGYNIVVNGNWEVVGGTSSGPPLIGGLVARLNQILGKKLGFLNPILYVVNSESFVDITIGNNDSYKAAVGCDPTTGLGRIEGMKLLKNIEWAIDHAEY